MFRVKTLCVDVSRGLGDHIRFYSIRQKQMIKLNQSDQFSKRNQNRWI